MNQSEANAEVRRLLNQDSSLTANEKSAIDKAILSGGIYIPKDMDVDYTSNESFTITQMSDSAQEKWQRAKDWGMSADDYAKYYPLYSASGKKKTEKIADLQAAGLSRR